jgi:hypothetical protein
MTSDLRAVIGAALDRSERSKPKPGIAELSPVTKAVEEMRAKVTPAIRAHATAVALSGAVQDIHQAVVQEIQQAHENAEFELLLSHRRGELDLFLDTDGTDKGVQRILLVNVNAPGSVDVSAIRRGSINGEIGTLVARRADLNASTQSFCDRFFADRGYSDFEKASNNHEITSAIVEERSTGDGLAASANMDPPVELKHRLIYGADLEKFMARWPDKALERLSGGCIASQYLADHQKRAQEGQAVPKLPHRRYIAAQAEKIRQIKRGIAVGLKSK